jgi:pyruvate formate lyase activating enzyme
VSHLVIPTLNDDLQQIRRLCKWVRDELGADTPFHFLSFRPMYRMQNLPPTSPQVLEWGRREALDVGLHHVYIGNLSGHEAESTYCPRDGTRVIHRIGFRIVENRLTADGLCPTCRKPIAGVWT